jgi:hypothetical protein
MMLESYVQHLLIEFSALSLVLFTGSACWYLLSSVNDTVKRFRPGPTVLIFVGLWLISCLGIIGRLIGPLNISLVPWLGLFSLGVFCFFGWVKHKKELPQLLSSKDIQNLALVCVLLIPFNTGEWGWDAGLYHISKGLHFLQTENITGLALLNTRFGFNPLTDIWHTLFLSAGVGNFAFYVLNDVVLAIFALFLLETFSKSDSRICFCILLTFSVLFIVDGGTMIFLDRGVPDFTSFALTSMAYICLFILVLSTSDEGISIDERLRIFIVGGLMALFTCTVKVSSAPLFLFFIFWWLSQFLRKEFIRSGLVIFLFCGLLGTLWLYTNYLVSGCWLYPADFTCPFIDQPQALTRGAAQYELRIILNHARAPIDDPPGAFFALGQMPDWYLTWWSVNKSSPYTLGIIIGACGSTLLLLIGLFRRTPRLDRYIILWCFLALHTFYWWTVAPALRYALFLPFMWVTLLVLLFILLCKVDLSRLQAVKKLPLILTAGLFVGVLVSSKMFSPPPKVPQASFYSNKSDTGFSINVAYPDIRCWDGPLPCASGFIFDWGARIDYDPARGYFMHPPSQ